jgi:hypothetical protein
MRPLFFLATLVHRHLATFGARRSVPHPIRELLCSLQIIALKTPKSTLVPLFSPDKASLLSCMTSGQFCSSLTNSRIGDCLLT